MQRFRRCVGARRKKLVASVTERFRSLFAMLPERAQLRVNRLKELSKQRFINRIEFYTAYHRYKTVQINSSAYTRHHPSARIGTEKSISQLLERLAPNSLILDAGCGDGYGQEMLRRHGHTAIGIDLNGAKLSASIAHGNSGVTLGDLHTLPYRSKCFNAIHCSHVLEHMLDATRALEEMNRVLRPSGVVLFVVPLGPGNRKHPTAFLDQADAHSIISPHFAIEEIMSGFGRGHPELSVIARSQEAQESN